MKNILYALLLCSIFLSACQRKDNIPFKVNKMELSLQQYKVLQNNLKIDLINYNNKNNNN